MADILQYVGARYVPVLFTNAQGTSEWQADTTYEPLTIVTYNNGSFTSKKQVPGSVGNPVDNPEYWVQTGNFNAQLADAMILFSESYASLWKCPEDFGAKANGITDDADAIESWLNSDNFLLYCRPGSTYFIGRTIAFNKPHIIMGNDSNIVFSENIVATDNYLCLVKEVNFLSIKNVKFSITASVRSPFVDSGLPNADGILLKYVHCSNVYIDSCEFKVLSSGVTIPCTPLWFTSGADRIYIRQSRIENRGYAQRSGVVWYYGTCTECEISDSELIGSTLDEIVHSWEGTKNEYKVTNCRIEQLRRNDQIVSSISSSNIVLFNCIIEFGNYINYRAFKVSGGKLKVEDCRITFPSMTKSFLFSCSGGSLEANDNDIYINESTGNNGGLLIASGGDSRLMRNSIHDIGEHAINFVDISSTARVRLVDNTFFNANNGLNFYINGGSLFSSIRSNFIGDFGGYLVSPPDEKEMYYNMFTGEYPSIVANQNPSMLSALRCFPVEVGSMSNTQAGTLEVPISGAKKSFAVLFLNKRDSNGQSVYVLSGSGDNSWILSPLLENSDYALSISKNTIEITWKSIYPDGLIGLFVIYDGKQFPM